MPNTQSASLGELDVVALRRIVNRIRKYAGGFDWPDKQLKERGIVKDFNESQICFASIKSGVDPNRPPDCEAVDFQGKRVGIEVTELVDRKRAGRKQGPIADWTACKFLDYLSRVVAKKDVSDVAGGPYDRYMLLIHTDETLLTPDLARQTLSTNPVARPKQIDEIYIIFFYHPDRGYEVVKVPF